MKPALLDVNILIALLWPTHEHHASAHRWFSKANVRHWATCPLTELAFVRILSNPSFSKDALSPANAISLLEKNLKHSMHLFWPDDLTVQLSLFSGIRSLEGHRQIMDMYLLELAAAHGGVLATMDQGFRGIDSSIMKKAIEFVPF
jgi:uncharacterized protein